MLTYPRFVMPGCVLRIGGHAAAVEELLAAIELKTVMPRRRSGIEGRERSWFNVVVSDIENNVEAQARDAVAFIKVHEKELARAREWPGVEYLVLDFSTARRDVAAQFEHFPADLVAAAGSAGLAMELSLYSELDDD